METTPNLDLPYIMAAQAQKHVTHNEAIRMLDALVNLTALDRLSTPPAEPQDGDRYIVTADADGAWTGRDHNVAAWQDGAWVYFAPNPGWRCYDIAAATILVWNGTQWAEQTVPIPPLQNLSFAGINSTADETNRLSVSANSTLLSHEGNDHRLVINKADAADTGAVLLQTNYTGHAQFGLSGDDDFRVSVSDNGNVWNDALVADATTGAVSFPGGVTNPQLHGTPEDFTAFDRLYIDAVNGDDANDGRTKTSALKSVSGLEQRFTIGRKLEIRLLSDIVFDRLIQIGYVVPQLEIFGRSSDDTGWQNRKITVVDSSNFVNQPGGFMFRSFASVYTYRIDVELATAKGYALFDFYNSIGFLRTHTMTLTRSGTGSCSLFSNGISFVPSSHTALTVDASAAGYVASGMGPGENPNDDWRYPSNLNSFG